MAERKGGDIGFNVTRRGPAGAPGEPAAVDQGTPIAFPAVFVPPPGAEYFTVQDEQDLAAPGDVVFLNPFQVPEQHRAAVNTVQFFSTTCDATIAGFTFTLMIGGNPRQGFTGLTIPQLGGAQGVLASPVYIDVPAQSLISARVHAPNGNPHHVGVFIQGWYWPITRGA